MIYQKDSSKAEEFIHHEEILDTLEYAQNNKDNRVLIEQLIEKAASVSYTHLAKDFLINDELARHMASMSEAIDTIDPREKNKVTYSGKLIMLVKIGRAHV